MRPDLRQSQAVRPRLLGRQDEVQGYRRLLLLQQLHVPAQESASDFQRMGRCGLGYQLLLELSPRESRLKASTTYRDTTKADHWSA